MLCVCVYVCASRKDRHGSRLRLCRGRLNLPKNGYDDKIGDCTTWLHVDRGEQVRMSSPACYCGLPVLACDYTDSHQFNSAVRTTCSLTRTHIQNVHSIMRDSRKGKLPIVDKGNHLRALTSRTDLRKNRDYPFASKVLGPRRE